MYKKITKISPYISTANIGDYIISDYCNRILSELFGDYLGIDVPSREIVSTTGNDAILTSDYTFVCGTNLLASDMRKYKQWNIDRLTPLRIALANYAKREVYRFDIIKERLSQIHMILFGVGWVSYQDKPTRYTKDILRRNLDEKYIHSVRDSYTEEKLNEIGIHNVLNTACPTMWGLTGDLCSQIPTSKSNTVVTTITYYRKSYERDKVFLDILLSTYSNVYLWLQSYEDYSYLEKLGYADKVKTIAPTLKCYDTFLDNYETDYIGTRLHGGIRALNHKKRSCIIGIDNRALEISKDTDLPVIKAEQIENSLREWIYNKKPTEIRLPIENINKWKSQFK